MENHLRKKQQRGQVAIFVALIFQVLFVFFAMIINVGLLVHHKINLQNSVDLAAYYGAMKQGEMMNAVGHVNYQIRQAYKLLMFRYYQLGSAGDTERHPYKFLDPKGFRSEQDRLPPDIASILPPFFCIAYSPVSAVNKDESYCKNLNGVQIPLPGDPQLNVAASFVFLDLAMAMSKLSAELLKQSIKGCEKISFTNWLMLSKFVNIYKQDIRNRKQTLFLLANSLSTEDPKDIEGKSVREGVFRTLKNNLTYQNRASLESAFNEQGVGRGGNDNVDFQFFNSLSSPECGYSGDGGNPKWLSEVFIYNPLLYMDANCNPNGSPDGKSIVMMPKFLNADDGGPLNVPVPKAEFQAMVDTLKPLNFDTGTNSANSNLLKSSLGVEKNPWCMSYVGVKAKMSPQIPFAPMGSIILEAKAYAKPFGGRIGPWYGTTWPAGARESNGSEKTDAIGPIRVTSESIEAAMNEYKKPEAREKLKTEARSYGRYLGDKVGVRSPLTMGEFGKVIHENFLPGSIELKWWDHMFKVDGQIDKKGTNGDPLAWSDVGEQTVPMRELEIAAIAPDHFDTTFYSIEPNFYDNYLLSLRKGYEASSEISIRGDLGARSNSADDKLKKFSIKDQLKSARQGIAANLNFGKMSYVLANPSSLLTSWQGKNPDDYSLDTDRFAKCLRPLSDSDASDENKRTPGDCVAGGRTGYSVKLISKEVLESNQLEIGGASQLGGILNQPPF